MTKESKNGSSIKQLKESSQNLCNFNNSKKVLKICLKNSITTVNKLITKLNLKTFPKEI